MREHFIISTKTISNFFHHPYFQRLSVTFLLQWGGYVLPKAEDRHPLINRKIALSTHLHTQNQKNCEVTLGEKLKRVRILAISTLFGP